MQWQRLNRPTIPPVSTEEMHDGLHLMADQDPELTRDAQRKVLAATYEFEDHGEIALITQTIRATTGGRGPIMDAITLGIGLRLPIGPVTEGTNVTGSIRAVDGEEFPLTTDQLKLWPGPRPTLHIVDDGKLPAAIRQIHAQLRIEYEAGFGPDHTAIPADIAQAITSQAALMQDAGWDLRRGQSGLSPHMARIAARYRGVAI